MLNTAKVKNTLRSNFFSGLILLPSTAMASGDIEFNTDVLDLSDRTNIDLSRFARSGFILPGTYSMVVQINNQAMAEQSVAFFPPIMIPKAARPVCRRRLWTCWA